MKTFFQLKNKPNRLLPDKFRSNDVRFPENLVEHLLSEFTKEGDVVLDPFTGFGTTMLVAEAMNRVPYGIEYDKAQFDYVQSLLTHPARLLNGDALKLSSYDIPTIDFSLSSPPYMGEQDTQNPFTAYRESGRGYQHYLADIASVYKQVGRLLKPNAKVVIEVSNVKQPRGVTTLAWDVGKAVSGILSFDGEIVIGWSPTYGMGYDHSYCLVFSAKK
jgi:DNA modification methylase